MSESEVMGSVPQSPPFSFPHTHLLLPASHTLPPPCRFIGPHLEDIFKPFAEAGWFEVCYGGKAVGEYLTA
jgi:hypothetical protein